MKDIPSRIADLLAALEIAREGAESLKQALADGVISTRDAEAELREIQNAIRSLTKG